MLQSCAIRSSNYVGMVFYNTNRMPKRYPVCICTVKNIWINFARFLLHLTTKSDIMGVIAKCGEFYVLEVR